jgi:hypothetical protein
MYTISILLCLEFFFLQLLHFLWKNSENDQVSTRHFSNVHFLLISYRFFLIVQSNWISLIF